MSVISCLRKMGFSKQEADLILEDIVGADAKAVVQSHIKALADERADIEGQLRGEIPNARAASDAKLQSPEADNPSMMIPDDSGKLVLATDAVARADAEVQSAEEMSRGFITAAECALRFGQ